ncbi:sulfite exporter TauE/SafE family protein 3-like isoform X1 [Rhodamnia argentea]|uniref:Sulfite exporter TauE/SafE family protein 3-like isoform X1 n=1 Tax=Rhodamnia argentea TaxID=178133 RepID=A0A8B8QQJ8_9MYRT|nr:sulfite exporter TauE/SafE family protein 3-like isoform X1 [Rhodamnia argentea]XP_030548738.1 sulfite exporter TauE/SafE family protein 3-like isoform X1 [Rhodamnia argentea]
MAMLGGAQWRGRRSVPMILANLMFVLLLASAERGLKLKHEPAGVDETGETLSDFLSRAVNFLWQSDGAGYQHVWPDMELGWQIVVGSIVGFLGAAFGSVGGVGGGGIFVPMLTLIIGFDPKSATAMSKCMIMGAAISTVGYNLKLRHPTLDIPIIDYDLVLLIQPMLMLGISIGIVFNLIFADWMVTILIILLSLGTSTKAFFKDLETWRRETVLKKEAAKHLESRADDDTDAQLEQKLIPHAVSSSSRLNTKKTQVSLLENVHWKEVALLTFVWVVYLILQISMNQTATRSTAYWVLNSLQMPVSIGVYAYEAISLYKGWRVIASKGEKGKKWQARELLLYCACAILAGIIGGLLGIGGGFVMGPLFLELGIPPEVASTTATFGMTFSSSMSMVEYYLLKSFPVPYALYFILVATAAAFVGQHIVRKLITVTGRASIIIFILSFTIFVSAILLGGVGISNMIGKIERHEYMGFEDLCMFSE